MKRGQFRVRLQPLFGGPFTMVQLSGCVPTAMVPRQLRYLAAELALWSGLPVSLALCADAKTAAWCELWVDCLKEIPEGHLEIRFVKPRGHSRPNKGLRT
jgi:hypothetical protein